ncbi:hypothetical protein SNE40_022922 [Patella caerulea]|uniref:Uncharacterized protein n=1 Tax=Patella caerulea TaxID=87958 RepID=A0AAN8J417_PATCE
MRALILLVLIDCAVAATIRPIQAVTPPPTDVRCNTGDDCEHVYFISYINDVAYCCPHGNGLMRSASNYVNGEEIVECFCNTEEEHPPERYDRHHYDYGHHYRHWRDRWLSLDRYIRDRIVDVGNLFRQRPFTGWSK